MRKLITTLLLLLVQGAYGGEAATVLVFGDSLSAGYGLDLDQSWTALLQDRLDEQGYEHKVVNASISGDTTEGGATRIDAALAKFSPALLILELGGNDGLRGIPLQRMKTNLLNIIEKSQCSGAKVVILGIRIPTNYGPRYTQAFEKVYRDIATQTDTPWIEFFMESVALNPALMQEDGIHPNAQAQSILLDNAWPVIAESLGQAKSD